MYKIILVILVVLVVGCTNPTLPPPPAVQGDATGEVKGEVTLVVTSIGNTTVQKYQVGDVTAFELLDYGHDIKMTYGDYLECIDGVCANKEYMWTFYVNYKESPLGVKRYTVKDGDMIEFRFNKGGQ